LKIVYTAKALDYGLYFEAFGQVLTYCVFRHNEVVSAYEWSALQEMEHHLISLMIINSLIAVPAQLLLQMTILTHYGIKLRLAQPVLNSNGSLTNAIYSCTKLITNAIIEDNTADVHDLSSYQ